MYPPPHMTCKYPPPHFTCMLPQVCQQLCPPKPRYQCQQRYISRLIESESKEIHIKFVNKLVNHFYQHVWFQHLPRQLIALRCKKKIDFFSVSAPPEAANCDAKNSITTSVRLAPCLFGHFVCVCVCVCVCVSLSLNTSLVQRRLPAF